ncbi:hypothetical protein RRG08_029894 [Elysia crispata]|uniref:Uncharacterized protein n=1 Tax=Elysia crispata TaxID=231223 RepID=A0AAE0YJC8_9GAST|nr:hypothetical protein RRG08_029894 [Elysia crispata]
MVFNEFLVPYRDFVGVFMASLMSELVDLDSTELDKLIHNFEYENQHCVKMIERKNQVINSLTSQIEHQVEEKRRLEEEISKFDEDTRRLHRNYTNNRDNISCLKNTMSVMSDHMGALSKQLSALQIKTCEESKTYNEHLSNYTKTRDEYIAKYRAFPLALNLEKAQKAVEILQERVKEIGKRRKNIIEQINEIEEAKMASRSDADVARLLNLNAADSDAFFEIVNGYFGPRNDLDVDEFNDADESDEDLDNFDGKVPSLDTDEQNSNTVVNEPVTTDLAEAIVPPLQRPDKPTKTATTKPDPPPAPFCICTDNPCHLKFSPDDIEQC